MIRLLQSKYRNKKTEIDGIVFDSKVEAEYYCHLKLLQKSQLILGFERQKRMLLQEGYTRPSTGTKVRPIFYVVDFIVYENNGHDGSLVGTTFGTVYYVKEKPEEILERLKEMYG